jgi:hypothetical protein
VWMGQCDAAAKMIGEAEAVKTVQMTARGEDVNLDHTQAQVHSGSEDGKKPVGY